MLKKENPTSMMRHELSKLCREKNLSLRIMADMTDCMFEKPDEEKEELAEKLIEIVLTSKTEEEMVERSRKLV